MVILSYVRSVISIWFRSEILKGGVWKSGGTIPFRLYE